MGSTNTIMLKILAAVFVMVVAVLAVVRVLGGIDTEAFTDTVIKIGVVFIILFAATWVVSLIQGSDSKKK